MPAPQGHAPYAGCETGGRPKIYTAEFIEKEADALLQWMKKDDVFYVKQFAVERGYHSSRLAEMAEVNEKFAGVLKCVKDWQECKMLKLGLNRTHESSLTKMFLGKHHDYAERAIVDQSQAAAQSVPSSKDLTKDSPAPVSNE